MSEIKKEGDVGEADKQPDQVRFKQKNKTVLKPHEGGFYHFLSSYTIASSLSACL